MPSDQIHSEYKIRLGSSIWYVLIVLRKSNILYPLTHTRTSAYLGLRNVTLTKNLCKYFINDALVVFISARNSFWNFCHTKEKKVRIDCYIDKSRIFCSIHNSQNSFLLSTILYFVLQLFCEWNKFFDNYFYLKQIGKPSCSGFTCICKGCIHVNWKTTVKRSLKYLKCILKISHSKYKNLLIS